LINTLPWDIQIWVWETTNSETGRIADDYLQACKLTEELVGLSNKLVRSGTVEGRPVEDIALDTICSQTMNLISKDKVQFGQYVSIQCAHGDAVFYLVARVKLEIDSRTIRSRRPLFQLRSTM